MPRKPTGRSIAHSHRLATAKNVLVLVEGYLRGTVEHRAVMRRYYEYIYSLHGDRLTAAQFQACFGIDPSPEGLSFVQRKLESVGRKYDRWQMGRRLHSSRHRVRYFTQRAESDDGTITPSSVAELLKQQEFRCAICGVYLTKGQHKQLDHIHPISKKGAHTISNVQWLCRTCNIRKKDKVEPAVPA